MTLKKYPVLVPSAGESITSAQIASWCKNDGDLIAVDDILLELETEKATLEVVSEYGGILRIVHPEGTIVKVGDAVAHIEQVDTPSPSTPSPQKLSSPPTPVPPVTPPSMGDSPLSVAPGHPFPSASVVLQQKNLSPADIAHPSGVGNRISLQDALSARGPSLAGEPLVGENNLPSTPQSTSAVLPTNPSNIQPISLMRKTIANRLKRAQLTKAILSTFNEVDMFNVMELRKTYKDDFFKKHQVKLGLNGFFIKSSAQALKEFPIIGGQMDEQHIHLPTSIDISIAVSTPRGLAVPVLRQVDQLTLPQIEAQIEVVAKKGRNGKLSPQDMAGGCFTITNGGVFGSMLSTPIINGEQSAILGLHNIVMRPSVVHGQIVIRPMMYIALSYDHRLIDGEQAVRFLVAIKRYIEDPLRILVDV